MTRKRWCWPISRPTTLPASGGARPKPDPFSRLPRTLLPPAARDYIVVEYELPNPRAQPHEVAVDQHGNGWVTQRVGGRLGRLDRKTLAYSEFVPPSAESSVVRLNAIRRGNAGSSGWSTAVPTGAG